MILVCLGSEWPVPGVQIVNSGAKWRAEGKKLNHLAVISWSLLFAPSLNAWNKPGSDISFLKGRVENGQGRLFIGS